MDELETEPPLSRNDHNVGLFLALYLLLLAFFVVLYSVSQREEVRTAAAINSLTATFRTQSLTSVDSPQFTSTVAPFDPVENFRRKVRTVFERELPVARFDILQLGNAMRVTVPIDTLFAPAEASLRPERANLMDALADALGRRSAERHFEVELIIGSGQSLPAPAGGPDLATRRAGALARDLRSRGVAAASIAAGVGAGNPAVVEMLFFGRRDDEAKVTFEHLARISPTGHGLRGAVTPTGQESRAARCGASGKRLDAPCRRDSAARRVAPRRAPAASKASTVALLRFSAFSWRIAWPGRDAGRDQCEKCGLLN